MKENVFKCSLFSLSLWQRAAFLIVGGFLLLATVGLFEPARAQNTKTALAPSSFVLLDEQARYHIGSYMHVSRNPAQTFNFQNYQSAAEKHLAGDRANIANGNILNLGSRGVPYWIFLDISNKSWTDKWVLSFGQHMDGRYGLIDELLVYDHFNKTAYINTIRKNKDYASVLKGNALTVTIPRGRQTLLFLYIVPKPGISTTIAPELMTEAAYKEKLTSPLSSANLVNFFFIAMIALCFSSVLFRGLWSGCLFSLYYLILFFLFRCQNETIQTTFSLAPYIPGVLFNASFFPGLIATRIFCGAGKLHRTQRNLAIFVLLVLTVSSGTATFFIPPDSLFQMILMYGAPISALLFLFMLSMAQGYTGRTESYFLAAGWFFVFLGSLVSAASFFEIFTPRILTLNAYWMSLLIQGGLLIAAMTTRFIMEDRSEKSLIEESAKRQEIIRNITAAKEVSENARLIRMIEHEREIMNELRDREAQQNEEMKKAKEEADHANNAKSAFLAVISHEIRTPMTGIMGMIRLLLGTALNREQKDYAQTLLDSGNAMMSLLNDILDFEKIESGKMEIEKIDFDLHRLIGGVKTLMAGHAEARNIYLKIEIDPSLPHYMIGDPVRLRQVILNLTGNSIKFTGEGGVTIRIRKESASKNAEDENTGIFRVRFEIEDTGVGISKEAQKNLFSPFSQADSSVARKFGGTGLGLAISQKLIEAMGGRIEINSAEGRGSTFFFTILMEEGSVEAVEKAEKENAATVQKPEKAIRIMIVEDNAVNQKLLKELVERMGHQTGAAGSGEEALKILETQNFDMILMDIHLPGITGMGTTKAIRALHKNENAAIPVIALTGNVRDEDVRQCYAANMNGHLSKPVDPKKLKDMIAKVISGKLDNPVEILQEQRDEHTRTVHLDIGGQKRGEETTPVLRALKNNSGIAETASEKRSDMPQLQAKRLEDIAPITALALGNMPPLTLEISEEELDNDSFGEAMTLSWEGKEIKEENNIFDHTLFEGMRQNIGDTKLRELFTDMFSQAEILVEKILAARVENNIEDMIARAHELKGMAGNFGLIALSQLAAQIESATKDVPPEKVEEALSALYPASEQVRHLLGEFLGTGR